MEVLSAARISPDLTIEGLQHVTLQNLVDALAWCDVTGGSREWQDQSLAAAGAHTRAWRKKLQAAHAPDYGRVGGGNLTPGPDRDHILAAIRLAAGEHHDTYRLRLLERQLRTLWRQRQATR